MKCRHLSISEEAYDDRGNAVPAFLCGWPDDAIGIAPAWVRRQIGGGQMVHPEVECVACPCFQKQVERGSAE